MKTCLWNCVAFVSLLSVLGCDTSPPSNTTAPPPVAPRPGAPDPARADVKARNGNVDVEVGQPGEKPAVDVDVKPGGDVDVDIDRDKIRERIDERREERREERLPERL